jgi:hypothetical protein
VTVFDRGRLGGARLVLILVLVAIVGCDATTTSPPPSGAPSSAAPGASSPPGADATSQGLIAADLASGAITLPESLRYRAWALFGDPRLPARYDGAGSAYEDTHLFDEIAEILPELPAAQRAELEAWLLRPTDPRSPFTAAESGSAGPRVVLAQAAEPEANRCAAPRRWVFREWSPNNDVDTGIRAWACDVDDAAARADLDEVLDIYARLWPAMTRPAPDGMGPPIPDTTATDPDGSGKIDVYLLEPLATCRQRGAECVENPGGAAAAAPMVWPTLCGVAGFPARGCAGFMIVGRQWLGQDFLVPVLAHEFFHVLQKAHHVGVGPHWYVEASATWAEWQYVVRSDQFPQRVRDYAHGDLETRIASFQARHTSLLQFSSDLAQDRQFQYDAWLWPLFQATVEGPSDVFRTWVAIESASSPAEFDEAIDRVTSFSDRFRDFAVRNAQPEAHLVSLVDEMADDRWQSQPHLGDFPTTPHVLRTEASVLAMGRADRALASPVGALEVHYEEFTLEDDAIRQITIDIGALAGADHADLDVIGLVQPGADSDAHRWRRYRAGGTQLTLCRDDANQDVIRFEVVISNHSFARSGDGPDPAAALSGAYVVEAKDKCDVPAGFSGTIGGSQPGDSWTGTATFELVQTSDPRFDEHCSWGDGVSYCYVLTGGQVTWTAEGRTITVSLGPGDGYGHVQLFISDPYRENRNGTYMIRVGPEPRVMMDVGRGFKRLAPNAWTHNLDYRPIPAGFALAATQENSGCGFEGCGTQIWTWDLTPVFNQ